MEKEQQQQQQLLLRQLQPQRPLQVKETEEVEVVKQANDQERHYDEEKQQPTRPVQDEQAIEATARSAAPAQWRAAVDAKAIGIGAESAMLSDDAAAARLVVACTPASSTVPAVLRASSRRLRSGLRVNPDPARYPCEDSTSAGARGGDAARGGMVPCP